MGGPVTDSISAEVRGTRPNSSFVGSGELNLSPQDIVTATKDFPVVTLGVAVPVSPGLSDLITPTKRVIFDRTLTFPALVGSNALIKIKYRSEWQNKSVSGGSRSAAKPSGYRGYRGRQISFTVMLNASDFRTIGSNYSLSDTIETLRSWSKLEITHAIRNAAAQTLEIKINDDVNTKVMKRIYQFGMSAIQRTGEFSGEPTQAAHVDKMAAKWDYIDTAVIIDRGWKADRMEFKLNNPVPMFPLAFRFGALRMSPCVIKKAEISVLKYSEGVPRSIDAAKVSFVLQEILNESTIWANTETPKGVITQLIVSSKYADPLVWREHKTSGGHPLFGTQTRPGDFLPVDAALPHFW